MKQEVIFGGGNMFQIRHLFFKFPVLGLPGHPSYHTPLLASATTFWDSGYLLLPASDAPTTVIYDIIHTLCFLLQNCLSLSEVLS